MAQKKLEEDPLENPQVASVQINMRAQLQSATLSQENEPWCYLYLFYYLFLTPTDVKLVYKPNISKSVSPDISGIKNPLAFQMVCMCHCIITFVWIAFKILFLPFVYVRAINSSMKNYRSPYNSHSWEQCIFRCVGGKKLDFK